MAWERYDSEKNKTYIKLKEEISICEARKYDWKDEAKECGDVVVAGFEDASY